MPLQTRKIDHYLAIGDIYLDLGFSGGLQRFMVELRDEFKIRRGKTATYAPDAFFVWRNKAYLLEVQLATSALSEARWGEKWKVAESFFAGEDYKTASWQIAEGKVLRPPIVVVTDQNPERVKAGAKLNLLVVRDIKELG